MAKIQWKQMALPICVLLAVLGFLGYGLLAPKTADSSSQNNVLAPVLAPGQIYQTVVIMPPDEVTQQFLKYISSAPDVIEVSDDGFLLVHQGQLGEKNRTVDIAIQSGNKVLETQTFIVDFTKESYEPPVEDINDFVPNFLVEQQIRLAGTSDWGQTVEAKVGDFVEIQIQYQNLADFTNEDVMVRSILPTNLAYIPGSTKLYNGNHPNGASVDQDTVVTTGINIGAYSGSSGANAYVRFTARVVEATLEHGSNTLVNWSQCCVNGVTLQDYATVTVDLQK